MLIRKNVTSELKAKHHDRRFVLEEKDKKLETGNRKCGETTGNPGLL
jgi:hypothetical protein